MKAPTKWGWPIARSYYAYDHPTGHANAASLFHRDFSTEPFRLCGSLESGWFGQQRVQSGQQAIYRELNGHAAELSRIKAVLVRYSNNASRRPQTDPEKSGDLAGSET